MLRSSVWSPCHFWRKSLFLNFKTSFLKEFSHKSCVFELQSFNFEGSLAEKLCFWTSKRHFLKEVSQKRKSPRRLNLKSCNNQMTWIWNQLTTKSFKFQNRWQPNHLNLKSVDNQNHLNHTTIDNQITSISNQLPTKPLEPQVNWQANPLNLKSIDNQNHLTTKSIESQMNWQPNHLNLKAIDNQNHLNLKSDENQIIWLSTRLNLTSIVFRTIWTPHTLFL